jgi:hypothetical protein
MKRGVIIGITIFLALLLALYNWLGGFKEVEIQTLDNLSYEIIGKPYTGRYKDQQIEQDFNEIKQKVEQKELEGTFAIITYKEPSEHEGEIEIFTGVIMNKVPETLPQGYEHRTITAPKAVQAEMEAHPAVLPPAEKVRQQMEAYAEQQKLNLQEITIDKYLGEGHLQVVIPAE